MPASFVWGFGRPLWDPGARTYGRKPLHVMLLGPAASGKTALAEQLAAAYCVPSVNVGDLLYEEVAQRTALGLEAKQYMEGSSTVPDRFFMQVRCGHSMCWAGVAWEGWLRGGRWGAAACLLASCAHHCKLPAHRC